MKTNQIIDHAEESCKSHGARLTKKRKQILSTLINSSKALSAYDLIEYYQNQYGETLPAMSVYRILDFLKQENLVHRLNLANKFVACSHITCDHDHGVPQFLICSKCDKVQEITIDQNTIGQLKTNVESANFQLVSPQLEMNCVCNDCFKADQ